MAPQKTVLIVDDSETVRKLLVYVLRPMDLKFLEAQDGLEALEIIGRHQENVDLVITDLNMPNMDGLELVRSIRTDDAYKDIPIIMLTTETEEMDRQLGYDSGINVYLVKPVQPQVLVYKVMSLLGVEK